MREDPGNASSLPRRGEIWATKRMGASTVVKKNLVGKADAQRRSHRSPMQLEAQTSPDEERRRNTSLGVSYLVCPRAESTSHRAFATTQPVPRPVRRRFVVGIRHLSLVVFTSMAHSRQGRPVERDWSNQTSTGALRKGCHEAALTR